MKLISMHDAAKILGIGSQTLFKTLRAHGVLINTRRMHNSPATQYVQLGYFRVDIAAYNTGPVRHLHAKTLVTPSGLAFIAELLNEHHKSGCSKAR